jgi:hypothetical protein
MASLPEATPIVVRTVIPAAVAVPVITHGHMPPPCTDSAPSL